MSKFKVGDKIKVVNDETTWLHHNLKTDDVFTVVEDNGNSYHDLCQYTHQADLGTVNHWAADFALVPEYLTGGFTVGPSDSRTGEVTSEQKVIIPITRDKSEELGMYRPNLQDRKVGKVRVELVDDGFPLALREIAKVMSWAQTAKGYKDHDWQNLPNAEVALAAAASRHRTDHIKQRMVDGLFIKQCVDGESELLHKAHEAFGVLAQLELMLRGDIE